MSFVTEAEPMAQGREGTGREAAVKGQGKGRPDEGRQGFVPGQTTGGGMGARMEIGADEADTG